MGGAEGVFELAHTVSELGYFLMEFLGGGENEARRTMSSAWKEGEKRTGCPGLW